MGSCFGSCVPSNSTTNNSSTFSATNSSTSSASSSSTASSSSLSCLANSWLCHRRRRARSMARARIRARVGTSNTTDTEHEPPDDTELISHSSAQSCQRRGLVYRILKFKRKQQCPQFLDKYWEQQPNYAKLQTDNAPSDIQLQNLDAYKLLNNQSTPNKETEILNYQRMANSRASSSLDLEWEHEYSQLRQYHQHHKEEQTNGPQHTPPPMAAASLDQLTTASSIAANHVRHQAVVAARQARLDRRLGGSFTRTSCCSSTQNSWSHISTPESLEWDVDEEREQQRQLRLEDDNLDDETLKLLHQIEQLKHHVLQETGDGLSMGVVAMEELSEGLQFRATHFATTGSSELEAHIS
ncbi:uncharacterized protein LOC6642577 [Drosophila willistoni]|uniref:uncharacterized protein LOC6642577 n=1 Tax=Drosophila willistoni TaxID=7260 RepID=UPI00017D73CC|nr:uncharacterized protein LOC6642577 [Drosophila willistoni]